MCSFRRRYDRSTQGPCVAQSLSANRQARLCGQAHTVHRPELILAELAVPGRAKQLGGNVLHSIPEGALEVPDTSGAEFFRDAFYFYEYYVAHNVI